MIDSHAHIHFKDFEGKIDDVLQRAHEAGVTAIVNVGTDRDSSHEVVSLAHRYPQIFAVVGIHPHDVAKMHEGDDDLKALESLACEPKVVAIGEVGLDYYYEHSPKEVQQSRLRDFIALAKRVGKPLVIHCRDAFNDCFRIFDEEDAWSAGGVFHCYTGDVKTAERIVQKGFYVSFSGIVTFKKATDLQEAARIVPSDRFLIETDCPFLAPEPHRGKRNEPAYVRLVAEKIAKLRGVSAEEIGKLTTKNTRRIFHMAIERPVLHPGR